jgi:hypothetical protein
MDWLAEMILHCRYYEEEGWDAEEVCDNLKAALDVSGRVAPQPLEQLVQHVYEKTGVPMPDLQTFARS